MSKTKHDTKNSDAISLDNLKGFLKHGARTQKNFIPTGHFNLDFSIRYGTLPDNVDFNNFTSSGKETYDPAIPLGLPSGRLVELFGGEGSGKSSLAYRIVGFAQKMNHKCVWIDTEHSFEEELAEVNGVDIDELLYSSLCDDDDPDKNYFAEDIMDKIVDICKTGEVKVVVLDSVANLIPKEVDEKNADQQNVAKLARILGAQLGKIVHYASKHNVLVIFINQVREKPGVLYGSPETTPGGRALKFNASVRLKMTKRNSADKVIFIDDNTTPNGKRIIGRYSGVTIEKNRVGPPLLDANGNQIQIEVPVYYKAYFPDIEERIFDVGRQFKVISVRNNVFTWKDKDGNPKIVAEGRSKFISNVKETSTQDAILDQILEENQNVVFPPEILKYRLQHKEENKEVKDENASEEKGNTSRGRKKKSNETGN
jgi:recombination protein RecA